MPTDKQYRAASAIAVAQINAQIGEPLLESEAHGEIQRPHSGGAWVAVWLRVPLSLAAEAPE